MIPEIGILVAFYVMTRMLELLYTPPTPRGRTIVGASAGITIAIAIFVAFDLLRRGSTIAQVFDSPPFR